MWPGPNKGEQGMATTHGDGAEASLHQEHTTAQTATSGSPGIVVVADDELVVRRIDALLGADGMRVEQRAQGIDDVDAAPDVLVMTFGRGITERDQTMRRVRKEMPTTHLVAVIPEDSRRGVRRALEAGAAGVVFEAELEPALAPTIRAALAGQIAVPAAERYAVDRPTLSGREKQVLGMVVMAVSNKAIASELYLAESTVKCHLSSAFAKLGVRSRHEAADLILHSGSDFDLGIVGAPDSYAATEGSETMSPTHRHDENGERA
jgi:DNA-binding NarL/FixJ family response regulator